MEVLRLDAVGETASVITATRMVTDVMWYTRGRHGTAQPTALVR